MNLLSVGSNPKTDKSDKNSEYITAIMHLLAHKISGKDLCGSSTEGCRQDCLIYQGRGKFSNVFKGRMRKSRMFIENKTLFMDTLIQDIEKLIRKCEKLGKKPAVRLNGTSDLPFENIKYNGKNIFELFPNVTFYDYTKNWKRDVSDIPNYSLTYSRSEKTEDRTLLRRVKTGQNVAVVFRSKDIPKVWKGLNVFNGDITDLRFLDPKNVIVGLYAKGSAKHNHTGFVVDC